jgi:hypothetical protein
MVPFSTSPFARTVLLAVGRDRVYVADNARYDVRVIVLRRGESDEEYVEVYGLVRGG